jgi:hypothetical protein
VTRNVITRHVEQPCSRVLAHMSASALLMLLMLTYCCSFKGNCDCCCGMCMLPISETDGVHNRHCLVWRARMFMPLPSSCAAAFEAAPVCSCVLLVLSTVHANLLHPSHLLICCGHQHYTLAWQMPCTCLTAAFLDTHMGPKPLFS